MENAIDGIVDALRVIVAHAQEQYPHFEGPRGQRDIKQALMALGRYEKEEETA